MPGPMPEQTMPDSSPSASSASEGSDLPPLTGGAGAWMAHVKKTMRANKGKSLKEVLKLAKKTYHKGTKKTARNTRKSRKSKSWFMGGSTIVAAPYTGSAPQAGSSRRSRGRKH